MNLNRVTISNVLFYTSRIKALLSKQFACVILVVLALSACLVADESSRVKGHENDVVRYFPTAVGTKWVYDHNNKEESMSITAVEEKGKTVYVTTRGINTTGGKTYAKYKMDESGLYQVEGASPLHEPIRLLMLPHKQEQKWDTWLGAPGNVDNTMIAYGPEKIQVPSGTYDAIRVETKFFPIGTKEIPAKYWYAPSVGLVKEEYGETVIKLKSFSVGNK